VIVETGCVRAEKDWDGAGQSTMVWDWMAKHQEGGKLEVVSIDNDPAHVELASRLCTSVSFVCMDSIEELSTMPKDLLERATLLFLDSMDHNPPYGESELHAAGELAVAWRWLPKGCLIAVDDCNPDGTGKHFLVRQFFERLKIRPEFESHITIWRKP